MLFLGKVYNFGKHIHVMMVTSDEGQGRRFQEWATFLGVCNDFSPEEGEFKCDAWV